MEVPSYNLGQKKLEENFSLFIKFGLNEFDHIISKILRGFFGDFQKSMHKIKCLLFGYGEFWGIRLLFQKNVLFWKLMTHRVTLVCNWEKFQFRSILRHFLQSLSSRCQSSLDESWIWFRWQFPNRFLKNRCSGQSHGKIYLKIEWNFRAYIYYLFIKISLKFK